VPAANALRSEPPNDVPNPVAAANERPALPGIPVLKIEGGRRWVGLELRDLWAHRDLFYFLAWRDVKVRYKQTALGVTWAVLQPFLSMVVFTVLFGHLAHVPSDGEPYAIFVYAGLLVWNFFSTAVTSASNSVVGNAALITKVYFPRLVIPAAAVGAAVVDFAIASAILLAMMLYYGVPITWGALMFFPLAVLTALTAMAVGFWAAAVNVKYRDVRYALPFLINICMYATPVIYPVSFIPKNWRWVLMLNPLSGTVQGVRSAVFGKAFDWSGLVIASAITMAILVWAIYSFRRMEREFADII
jgi:lipopolysaccharide transport system permease protein